MATAINEQTCTKQPMCLLVIGKAGVGKTTFVHKLTEVLHTNNSAPYVINLDPAVRNVSYPINIDIRTTVSYKDVIKEYKMGPNGAITTCLNLFTTVFDKLLDLIKKKAADKEFIVFDTPGQMEVFSWSASGSIITNTLASYYPTVILFLMDSVQCNKANTFLSSLLACCSVMFQHKLPVVVVLNKADIVKPDYAWEWTSDFEEFREALLSTSSMQSTLNSSLSLHLSDLYSSLDMVAVSSVTGEGMTNLFPALERAREEYFRDFKPIYDKLKSQPKKVKSSQPNLPEDKGALFLSRWHTMESDEEESSEDDELREEQYFQESLNL